jgi:catechol 2,3-dioxygenase-like lactoylglutathione lyase family enzyme
MLTRNRGFDHLVLCVRDLDAACALYTSLGFTVTPRALHPFGTGNAVVQFRRSYLELLTVVDPARIPQPHPGEFSFGAYNQAFLNRHEGFSMLAFESEDARRDREEFTSAGLITYPVLDFARKARMADGEEIPVAFSLAFLTEPRLPEASFFTCQHRTAGSIWDPDFQDHGNGATGVSETIMTAPDPRALMGFFARLQGHDAVSMRDGQLSVQTARGRIVVLDREGTVDRFGDREAFSETPRLIGYQVALTDLAGFRARLDAGAVPYRNIPSGAQISAFGTCIEFVAS